MESLMSNFAIKRPGPIKHRIVEIVSIHNFVYSAI